MTAALQSTFAPLAPAFDGQISNAWRVASQEVADNIRFVRQYRKVIAEAGERLSTGKLLHSAAYVDQCAKRLPWQLSIYLGHVRTISECEAKMDAIGMAYAKSSDAWGE
jgi:hypothetical protein